MAAAAPAHAKHILLSLSHYCYHHHRHHYSRYYYDYYYSSTFIRSHSQERVFRCCFGKTIFHVNCVQSATTDDRMGPGGHCSNIDSEGFCKRKRDNILLPRATCSSNSSSYIIFFVRPPTSDHPFRKIIVVILSFKRTTT